jgi:predicted nucleotidyltransferase
MGVADWFSTFCGAISIGDSDWTTIRYRYHQITKRINLDYYGTFSETAHSLYVGSVGRDTEIFTSDIDMLVQLPYETYAKFNAYTANGQSALLQEVKGVLGKTYSTTNLKGDGQIIILPFSDGIDFEVLPAFGNTDGIYTFPNSHNGGSWKTTDPKSEIEAINQMNNNCNKNLKPLCRMARAWKVKNDVGITGILIDILAYRFISTWTYRDKSYLYYDYMSRDFFKYLSERNANQTSYQVMGSGRYIYDYGSFVSKAKTAYNTSLEAIAKESDYPITAKSKWREIYGSKFPS